MPPIHLLIKPASAACNMNCTYCFYKSVAQNRQQEVTPFMSEELLEKLVVQTLEEASGSCGFAFQGGEPTLIGLDFYKKLIQLQKKHNKKGLPIHNSIQTNGYLLDEEWAKFLAENKFLIGLSLDGTSEIHNLHRVDNSGKGTFNKVLAAAKLLDKHKADYNILSVVTSALARDIRKTYAFYKKNNLRYLQFIPCLEPLGQTLGGYAHSLTAEKYTRFLITLFDLWYQDILKGEYTSIRYFDNLVHMAAGRPPESCNMRGVCSAQFVVEGDGSVYPCDFYVTDEYKIGTIGKDSFKEMYESITCAGFIKESYAVPAQCKECKFYPLCRNGCKRDRIPQIGDAPLNAYCASYTTFFKHSAEKLFHCAKLFRL